MFCPKCKAEYRSGFTECSDCRVPLVPSLPEEAPGKNIESPEKPVEYVEVLRTLNPADIAFIKSLLDTEDILYYFHGEQFTYVEPLADPARLMVDKEEADHVRELLKDADLSIMGINLGNDKKRRNERRI